MKKVMLWVLLASPVLACDKGYIDYEGVCASTQASIDNAIPVTPSDEKPPRSGLPSWQDPSIHALMPPSLVFDDEKQDQAKNDATIAGKKAAGILPN